VGGQLQRLGWNGSGSGKSVIARWNASHRLTSGHACNVPQTQR
jgi:hypothetical protein